MPYYGIRYIYRVPELITSCCINDCAELSIRNCPTGKVLISLVTYIYMCDLYGSNTPEFAIPRNGILITYPGQYRLPLLSGYTCHYLNVE